MSQVRLWGDAASAAARWAELFVSALLVVLSKFNLTGELSYYLE